MTTITDVTPPPPGLNPSFPGAPGVAPFPSFPPFPPTPTADAANLLAQGRKLGQTLIERFASDAALKNSEPARQQQAIHEHFAAQNWAPLPLDSAGELPTTEDGWQRFMAERQLDSLAVVTVEDGVPHTTVLTRSPGASDLRGWSSFPTTIDAPWVDAQDRVTARLVQKLFDCLQPFWLRPGSDDGHGALVPPPPGLYVPSADLRD